MAQFNLGFMYANGQGAPKDAAEAVRWTRMAAEQGDEWAQFNLGLMYDQGNGIPQDYVQAYAWISVAAAQGIEEAKKVKEILPKTMFPAEVDEAEKLSREYWEAYGPGRGNRPTDR